MTSPRASPQGLTGSTRKTEAAVGGNAAARTALLSSAQTPAQVKDLVQGCAVTPSRRADASTGAA